MSIVQASKQAFMKDAATQTPLDMEASQHLPEHILNKILHDFEEIKRDRDELRKQFDIEYKKAMADQAALKRVVESQHEELTRLRKRPRP